MSKSREFNKSIEHYLEKNPEEREMLLSNEKPYTTLFYENDNLITQLACFENHNVNQILFVNSSRSSYHSSNEYPYLYVISFVKGEASPPRIHLYRFEDDVLKLLFVTNMCLISKTENFGNFECFSDTPLKITLNTYSDSVQSSFCLKNKKDEILFSGCSAETIDNPVDKLYAYLDNLYHCESFDSSEIAIKNLLEQIASVPEQSLELIDKFSEDIIGLNLLVRLEPLLEDISLSRQMIETALSRGFGLEYEKIENQPNYGMHPLFYRYFELFRYNHYDLTEDLIHATLPNHLYYAKAKKMEKDSKIEDNRLLGYTMIPVSDEKFEEHFERLIMDMENSLGTNPKERKSFFNRMIIHTMLPVDISEDAISDQFMPIIEKFRGRLRKLRVEKIILRYSSEELSKILEFKNILGEMIIKNASVIDDSNLQKQVSPPNLIESREMQIISKDQIWAYRIPSFIHSIAAEIRKKHLGMNHATIHEDFIELDIDHSTTVIHPTTGSIDYNYGELIPVSRPFGHNEAGVVIGIITSDLGMDMPVKRMLIIGDLSHSSRGAIRGQECIRINAAIRLAARENIPIDWYSASYGVQIHRERGVEGLDAAASTVREIVENCHHKGVQMNLIIDETNIGAQSYWDSLAAIVYDTSGILIMTPNGSMALTGPKSLTCALYGKVHSEEIDNYAKNLYPDGLLSLSGHELVHGPNSDSMLLAKNIEEATHCLLLHHYYSYLRSSEKLASPRRVFLGNDFPDEDIDAIQIELANFLKGLKPNRNRILDHLRDAGSPPPLQFWADAKGIRSQTFQNGDLPQEASTIVQEMLIGGHPTMVIFTPTGPMTPADADIIARAIYKSSGRMQLLIIGSLSGFSCDPLSMKNRQLLEGALIAKAIVEHKGPILIANLGCLVGGTFVVFNKQLNQDLKIIAIEGARVQVIGGKSAAKIVFHSLICKQADQDERVFKSKKLNDAADPNYKLTRSHVIVEIEDRESVVFDQFHSAQRAMKVKSIDQIISPQNLKRAVIDNFEELRTAYSKKEKSASNFLRDDIRLNKAA